MMDGRDETIARVVKALEDDFHRQGGVAEGDLLRLVDKNGLGAEEQLAVVQLLRDRGIQIEEDELEEGAEVLPATEVGDRALLGGLAHRILRHEEVVEFARRMRQGEKAAIELKASPNRRELEVIIAEGHRAKCLLVESNLRLVFRIASEYQNLSDLELVDLFQEGILGLIRATELFDHRLGFKFSTYACWWIRQAVIRGIQNYGRTIRLPSHVHERLVKLRRVRLALWAELSREPRAAEIGEQLAWAPEDVQFLLDAARSVVSLNQPANADTEVELQELIADPFPDAFETVHMVEVAEAIDTAVDALPDRLRYIINQRFGLEDASPRTLEEIGQDLGLSRERVRQLQVRALEQLSRHPTLRELAERRIDGTVAA